MKILLFLCIGASLVHLGVQEYSYLTLTAPKHLPRQNSHDYVFLSLAFNLGFLDSVYEELENPEGTFHSADGVAVFLTDNRSPMNKNTKVMAADFENPTEAKAQLNKYVTDHTSGKIKNVFRSLDKNTDAVVISYVDKWKVPVSEGRKFTLQLTGEYNVMVNKELGFTMIEIPKNQYVAALYTIPDVGKEEAVGAVISDVNLALWRKSMTKQLINLEVPRATLYGCAALTTELVIDGDFEYIRSKYTARISATFP
ncbi:serine protease inhibitor A3L-like [Bufo gargarizans]|uniref:serine protease inhibitor A3L-like n=1 Tax=Bufo gargarizans TaxID=30331 RepID=UPI001CF23449|nr:serine protease inhibitor A3L-like [Bufo gargarizans]